MSEPEAFGVWLRKARKQRALSMKELAAAVGCSEKTISNAERCRSVPGAPLQARLREELSSESITHAAYLRGYAQAVTDMRRRLAKMEDGPNYHTRHGDGP